MFGLIQSATESASSSVQYVIVLGLVQEAGESGSFQLVTEVGSAQWVAESNLIQRLTESAVKVTGRSSVQYTIEAGSAHANGQWIPEGQIQSETESAL